MLDIHTLALVAMVSTTTASFATLMIWHLIPQERSLRDWTAGLTLLALGFFILSLRGLISNFFTVVIANTLLILSVGFLHLGTRKLLGVGSGRPWHWYAAVITFINCIITVYLVPNLAIRSIVLSMLYFPFFSSCAWMFWYNQEPQQRITERIIRRFSALIFALGALLFLIRAFMTPQVPAVPDLTVTASRFFVIPFLYVILASSWMGIMLTLIVSARLQRQLEVERDRTERTNQELVETLNSNEMLLKVVGQALVEQRQFVAMVSHEVRSPLAVIDSAAQVLNVQLPADCESLQVVARIRRGVARLVNFLDNCLTEDRLDGSALSVHPAAISLDELAAEIKESAQHISGAHHLITEIEAKLPPLNADPQLLRILLLNLLGNAIKYSPAESEVKLLISHAGQYCIFEVTNQGQGIAADEIPFIFQKYKRGRAAEGVSGAGLGLSLVSRIVDLHGKTVEVKGREGEGTQFVVKIPFASHSG